MAKPPTLIMGTSGHVDHGKTTLVKTLTGVDLDTLPEEKARGLTINLGFTAFETPSGKRIGVVDVPGHRRFIKTMLSGAHGLDFVLFLVAADDSVMPQTREHLQILRLLGLEHGLVVLTKIDLVDPELRELVMEEVRELVAGTFLEPAPILPVSSVTGEGMAELIAAIDELAARVKPRERGSFFRMFVDRVFNVAGAGVVVTGTTISGAAAPGDEVEVLPGGGLARVRKIEMHGESVERARAGQRTAINLRTVDKTTVNRGDLIATPGMVRPTYMIDAKLEVLADYPRPIRHWTRVRFYIGTSESFGRVVLLDSEEVPPGGSAYVQVRLETPIPAVTGDPYIIRDFSASWTMGGGQVLDAHPAKHKRKRSLIVGDLTRREEGYLAEVIELEAKKAGYFTARNDVARDLDVPLDRFGAAAQALAEQGKVVILPPKKSPWLIHREGWDRLSGKIITMLKDHHQALPQLQTGLHEQELRERVSRLVGAAMADEPFHGLLERMVAGQALQVVESAYSLSTHTASLGEDDQASLTRIRALYADAPMTPPATEDVYKTSSLPKPVVREFIDKLLLEGKLIRVSRDFLFEASAVEQAKAKITAHIRERGSMTVAEFRDLTGTTRKYAIPLLNYLDNLGVTRRDGDLRRLGPKA